MSIYKNLPRYEFGAMRGGGCDVSFLQAAGNMGVMKRLLDRILFCIAYKVLHQPFFGLKIFSQVLTRFVASGPAALEGFILVKSLRTPLVEMSLSDMVGTLHWKELGINRSKPDCAPLSRLKQAKMHT